MKDRNGKKIKEGSIVATAIILNHDTYKGFNFSTTICRRMEGEEGLILDGVHGWIKLKDIESNATCVIDKDSDMRQIYVDFEYEFPRKYKE